jgi:O-antigen ligase
MTRLNRIAFFLIALTVVVTTMLYGTVHQPTIALFYLAVVLILVLWVADGIAGGNLRFSKSLLQVPLAALGIYGVVQAIPFGSYSSGDGVMSVPRTISLYPFATEATAVHILVLCVYFGVLLSCLSTAARLRRLAAVLTVFGFIYAFYAILQSVLSPTRIYGIYETGYAIPFGSFVNRHHFAAVMEMMIAVPLGLLFTGSVRRDKKLLYVITVVLIGSSVLLSGSRGGLVAILCEVLLLIILTTGRREGKSLALKVTLAALLIGAVIGGAIFVGGDTSLTRLADTAASQDVTSNRTHIWGVTLKVIAANLPFGAGLGAYPQAYTRFDTASGLEQVEQAHNDYLQLLADAGLVGLIIGAIFLVLFIKEGLRNSRRHNTFRRGIAVGTFAGCTAVLIHSLFDFVLHTTAISVMFLTLMGMMIAAGRRYEDDIGEFDDLRRGQRRSASITPMRRRSPQPGRRRADDPPDQSVRNVNAGEGQ